MLSLISYKQWDKQSLIFFDSWLWEGVKAIGVNKEGEQLGVEETNGYLEEEVGSVVCLWILACLVRCSCRACCTSAGMSGEVWLIFMAASSSFTELRPLTFTSGTFRFFSSSSRCFCGGCGDGCLPASTTFVSVAAGWDRDVMGGGASGSAPWAQLSTWDDRALLLQMGQHSFQKTKRETTNRARPQKPTTTARRLTEMSVGGWGKKGGREWKRTHTKGLGGMGGWADRMCEMAVVGIFSEGEYDRAPTRKWTGNITCSHQQIEWQTYMNREKGERTEKQGIRKGRLKTN